MKKIGEMMKELGFNSHASESAKEAFLKYLIKQGEGINVQTPTEKKINSENPGRVIQFPQQLAFDFTNNEISIKTKNKVLP